MPFMESLTQDMSQATIVTMADAVDHEYGIDSLPHPKPRPRRRKPSVLVPFELRRHALNPNAVVDYWKP
ncbi:unnamed protein product [Peniophora sp. CBMAI 1063]|nr:unnamed protein product [Peniophora sp. CBMAI 1063]